MLWTLVVSDWATRMILLGVLEVSSHLIQVYRVKLQYRKKNNYAYLGAKTAVGDYITPETRQLETKPTMDYSAAGIAPSLTLD